MYMWWVQNSREQNVDDRPGAKPGLRAYYLFAQYNLRNIGI